MSTDVAALRAQLKAFERDFKQQHGHGPSVDDIKAAGHAERYKLYKKLSKKAPSSSSSQFPNASQLDARPSTPPRSLPRRPEPSASIIPKSRAIVTEIASSANPFSPVKDKGKQKEKHSNDPPLPSPFATSGKVKSAKPLPERLLSPDPFPLIDPPPPHQTRHPGPSNPVSRARKRLRGEPVSPSPVKEKRARVVSEAVLPFPQLSTLVAEDSDADDEVADAKELSFVADSPAKPLPKGKLLFDEDLSVSLSATLMAAKSTLKRSKSKSASNRGGNALLGARSQRARSMSRSSDELPQVDNHQKLPSMPEMKPADHKAQKASATISKRARMNGFAFAKDNLFEVVEAAPSVPLSGSQQGPTEGRSAKRPLDDEDDSSSQHPIRLPLLPPSPPPAGTGSGASYKGKGKAASRKKPKLLVGTAADEESSSSDEMRVKVREFTYRRPARDPDADFDPILGLGASDRPQTTHSLGPASDDEAGDLDVSLPDDLRRLLAIDPTMALDTHETGVVKNVLYGVRTTHYDGEKGGDVWDAGEVGGGTEGEEDWESEPVPWEVGEL
ncbi:hypothetical protein FA95DRAFT_1610636 [Auriscalpium vulgare]|uniref:Uncharacterized protein n=1 Tax=Auriscalpium vulgare TaxID=40419 RepID=A0ACB8RDJ7_9AGAM|nr:hypothetical protein FA95DRAFT_1610636 [Auriscalpium vulgare]